MDEVLLVLKHEIIVSHRKGGMGNVPTLEWGNNFLIDLRVKGSQFSSKVFICSMK